MKKAIFLIIVGIILVIVQYLTYYTISHRQLCKLAIENINVNERISSDTILVDNVITQCGNTKETIKPFNLNLYAIDNYKLIENKFNNHTIVRRDKYGAYADSIAQAKFIQINRTDWEKFLDGLWNFSELSLTAMEENIFIVRIDTSLIDKDKIILEANDRYLWILFIWIKI